MKQILLTQGKVAVVDDADYAELSKRRWCAIRQRGAFYAGTWATKKNGQKGLMHRIIAKAKEIQMIDHRDGDGLNNRRSNLRFCTYSQNQCNRPLRENNKSGYKGVSWKKGRNKWYAQIQKAGVVKYLGLFTCLIKAARAYDMAAIELHGEYALLNFPKAKTGD